MRVRASREHGLLAMAQELIIAPQILYTRRMLALRRGGDEDLLLSDNPALLQGPTAGPVGYLTAGVRLLLPIGVTTAFIIVDEVGPSAVELVPNDEVLEINNRVWRQAVRLVFASSQATLETVGGRLGTDLAKQPGGRIHLVQ